MNVWKQPDQALMSNAACESQSHVFFADYVDFLNCVTPDNQDEYILQMRRFNLGPVGEADCPVFDGMFDYCAVCAQLLQCLCF